MPPLVRQRLKALLIDWLIICGYLVVLAIVGMFAYFISRGQDPGLTEMQSQLIATFTSVVPVIVWFTVREAQAPFASYGKRQQDIKLKYRGNPWTSALVRNVFKFLPWQLGHIAVIDGMYSNWESPFSMVISMLSLFLTLTYLLQVVVTPSHRHLPDLFAGARVVCTDEANQRS